MRLRRRVLYLVGQVKGASLHFAVEDSACMTSEEHRPSARLLLSGSDRYQLCYILYYILCTAYGLLSIYYYLLFLIYCLLSIVCYLLYTIFYCISYMYVFDHIIYSILYTVLQIVYGTVYYTVYCTSCLDYILHVI